MLRVIIIDDEACIRETLAKLLAKHCSRVVVVGEACGVKEGVNVIRSLNPDLVFLGIDLKDGTGIDLLDSLNVIGFKIIFIAARDKNTIQAFKLSSVEYLLKPINADELKVAVRQVEEIDQEGLALQLKALEANLYKNLTL
ncbi:MAG: response regulator [Bacteroidetes bacterium]|nr:response regulator [Bacteroidota bacterium]